ncbi:3-oxoacyl-(acyl-carrier-protein) reductase, partial [human gut metagenome]
MSDFSNKVACITGAAGGMGRAVATELAKRHADLILCDLQESENFTVFIEGLKAEYGVQVYPFYFNLEDEESIKEGLKAIKVLKIKIDILVNNAGM